MNPSPLTAETPAQKAAESMQALICKSLRAAGLSSIGFNLVEDPVKVIAAQYGPLLEHVRDALVEWLAAKSHYESVYDPEVTGSYGPKHVEADDRLFRAERQLENVLRPLSSALEQKD